MLDETLIVGIWVLLGDPRAIGDEGMPLPAVDGRLGVPSMETPQRGRVIGVPGVEGST